MTFETGRLGRSPWTTVRNRVVLGVAGAFLVCGGGWLLTARPAVSRRLPGGWPTAPRDRVFADRAWLERLYGQPWWTPVVLAVACAVVGTAVAVLLLRARRLLARGQTTSLASGSRRLRLRALADAMAARVGAVEGVSRCGAVVRRRRRALNVELRIRLEPSAPPSAVLDVLPELADEARRSASPLAVRLHARVDGPSRLAGRSRQRRVRDVR